MALKPTVTPRRVATVLSTLGALAFAPSLHAQVLEIGSGGAVVVHDRPEITASTGFTPIATTERRRSTHAARKTSAQGARVDAATLNLAANGADLSPDLVEAVAWRESRLRHGAISSKGAIGEMQLMPGTAHTLGVDPFDSAQNLRGGAAYLRRLLHRYDGDLVLTLAAYNAGPGAVDRYKGVPPFKETRGYVADILDHMSERAVGARSSSKR